ncbi:MAG: hypothetical protein R2706_00240 [Acidimicrobiales bacterium]
MTTASFPFLSDEWIVAAKALRDEFADTAPTPPLATRINITITDIPHRDDDRLGHIDTTDGGTIIEEGHLDAANLFIRVDYGTAYAAFVTQNQQAVMQAFFEGKIYVEGDASQLLALQSGQVDPAGAAVYKRLEAITAKD